MSSVELSVKELDIKERNTSALCAGLLLFHENMTSYVGDERKFERIMQGLAENDNHHIYGVGFGSQGIVAASMVSHNVPVLHGSNYDYTYIHQIAVHPDRREPQDIVTLLRHIGTKAVELGDTDVVVNLKYGGTRYRYMEHLDLPSFLSDLGFNPCGDAKGYSYGGLAIPALEIAKAMPVPAAR